MKKILVVLLILSSVILPVFAQGKSEQSGSQEIVMWTFLDPANTSNGRSIALSQMIEEFEADNPGVKVTVEPKNYATMTAEFLTGHAVGSAPDIIWCARDELSGVLDAGALEPLENLFLGDWSDEEIADIDDAFFKFGEKDGKHYTLTLNKNALVMFYRADLLKKAGLEVPKTWDDLLEAAKAMTSTTDGIKTYGLGQSFPSGYSDPQLLANWLIDKQGSLFDSEGKANWANATGVEGVNWITNCIDIGVTPVGSLNLGTEDIISEFSAGRYGMFIAGAVRVGSIKDSASYDPQHVKVMPLPGGCIIDGWFAGIWSGSKNKEIAGKFLEKMYSPEADLLWVNIGAQAPVRASTLDNITIDENNDYLPVMLDAFANGWITPNDKAYAGWKINLNEAIQRVVANGLDPMKALQQTADEFNKANRR
jgi:multiple sugar transport system substrate-binding protein